MIVAAGWAALQVRAHAGDLDVGSGSGKFELNVGVEHLDAIWLAVPMPGRA